MSNVGESDVAIFPTFKGFRSTVESEVDSVAATSGNKFSSTFGKAVKGIGAGIAVGLGAAIAGAAAIASKGLDRALNIQDAKAQLTGLGHSAEAVATIMGSALDSVKGTAFGLDSAATIAASAVAAGIKPGEALTRTLKLTADAATIGKASLSEMGDMVNKVATNGKLTTQVLQQFQGRGIPLLQLVADQYGVTAEAAAEMVTKGEVDFANFQIALEKGVGGAALSSGATARGAFANIGASFGRLGAMFTGSAVDGAPALFVAISSAVDRLAESLKPLAEQFSGEVTPALARVTEWINGIDFAQVGATISTVFATIKGAIKGVVEAFQTGDFSELGSTFGKIGSVVQPLFPLFVSLAEGVGGIAGSIGDVISAGLPLLVPLLEGLADALGFLGDNPQFLAAGMVAVAAGMLASKAAIIGNNIAMAASIPLRYAEVVTRFQLTGALNANTAALAGNTVVEKSSLTAKAAGVAANVRQAASLVAARVAMVAGAVATGVATAAQWAMNAALSANPIGLIVLAIAALVAGLIYFFTQTELGQEIWANFTKFLSEAWANISAVFSIVWNGMLEVFTNVWNGIVAVFQFVWNLIVLLVKTYINTVLTIITTVVTAISTVWSAVWNGISSFFSGIWQKIIAVVTTVKDTFSTVFGAIKGIISGAFEGAVSVAKNAINGIINAVNGAISGINKVIGSVGAAFGLEVSIPKIPRLADGATVLPRSGGTLALLAEAGRAESVVDTGMMNALLAKILNGGALDGQDSRGRQGQTVFKIYEAVNAAATAMEVSRRQNAMAAV
ncbi:MAG: tape measure protein [Rhodoglobus sp.]